MEGFLRKCEEELSVCLRNGAIPPEHLVEAIACAKVKVCENAIDLCFRLKQEVGSYALMGNTGFEQMDFLQCCKFAEGDSRILMQKMARDRMRLFEKGRKMGPESEEKICLQLGSALKSGGKTAWDDNYLTVYQLAEATMDRIMGEFIPEHAARLWN